ncbi:uncharacterized protein LOC125468015 [Pyrus x bretschneideri]|uniref:uncharacterized protein LOC125468015 n=1 Tax=Pyrus x bretschneideri TaxID=225117 RepID=UPI00202DC4FC|nr:uncharacterized protein LOC125468015 [Pyrus x bretschneideri]XP_048420666.1 uncharacterized protein LOC125468015 [Pyrus x bretschneideri]XP_048420667.1 uncharacterized protein LOC125468015 [Pyrus x bretschneideri]XP_048420668.1 uncharacterized protein LOC125468015 [Pyrus x bretschneideri]XP_048420669.1 uncharacterized protein LOC125468015 [Pyrus x bretschneideri]
MANTSADTISLKALVDKERNQIMFIESENDFIDVVLSFLTIPMGTIVRLAPKQSVPLEIGCMKNLYASVENMDVKHFWSKACRDMLLCPPNGAEVHCKNLKLKIDSGQPTQYFICERSECITYSSGVLRCDCCGGNMNRKTELSAFEDRGIFVKGPARLIISDDLQLMPPFTAESLSIFSELGVMNGNTTEEVTFNVGSAEVLKLLVCSLVSKTPLTETLLKNKRIRKLSNEHQVTDFEPEIVEGTTNTNGNISVKLIVSKSKKMVCYAEVGEDFVNLLLGFLTIPLGFIVNKMRDCSLKGCISQLFKSVQDLDNRYMKSNYHKEILLSPKLAPGVCHDNQLLETEEATFYYASNRGMLSTDKTLLKTLLASPISGGVPSFGANTFGTSAVESSIKSMKVMGPKSYQDQEKGVRGQGFLEPAMFTVTDDLIIRPISLIFGLSLLNELKVPLTDIEVKIVHVGKEEALHLLMASLACDSALTNVFIREPKQEQR